MIEKLLELPAGYPQVIDVRHFGNPLLPAIGAFPPNQQVGRRQSQHDTVLKQIAFCGVLQDFQLLLVQVPLDVKASADTEGDEVNVESGGRRRVLPDLHRAFLCGVQSRGVAGVERFLELSRSRLAGLKPGAIDLDPSLQRVQVEAVGFEHQAVFDQSGDPAQAGLHSFRATQTINHQVAQLIELDLETHLVRALPVRLRHGGGRTRQHRG